MKKKYLLVSEIFGKTLQGEGPFIGYPATFVRLYGCVKPYCAFCDSKYSWDGKEPPKQATVEQVYDSVLAFDTVAFSLRGKGERWINNYKPIVVITGGEPLMQFDLVVELAERLMHTGYKVQIETSGKVWPFKFPGGTLHDATIVCSPKWYKKEFVVAPQRVRHPDYWKFVVEGGREEFKRIREFERKMNIPRKDIYVMPEGSNEALQRAHMQRVFKLTIEFQYKMTPRLHVLAFGQRRGV